MTLATLLRVPITIPELENDGKEQKQPKNKDYRLARETWFDGTVHWYIEQFVSEYGTLKELFPAYPTWNMTKVNDKVIPYVWIKLPTQFDSEEEAIEYLNSTLRSCEVMEVSHCYLD
jgi:hypothetical protein